MNDSNMPHLILRLMLHRHSKFPAKPELRGTPKVKAAYPVRNPALRTAVGLTNGAERVTYHVLKGLDYEPQIDLLGVPVILTSMKEGTTDIWLDNWMPSQTTEVAPYLQDGSVESLSINLEGAGYGPVVPNYVAEAGVKDLKDLGPQADKFDSKIYGIEPGK